LGGIERLRGNIDQAIDLFEEALIINRELEDSAGISQALNNLGNCMRSLQRVEDAIQFFEESLEIKREIQDRKGIGITLNNLGVMFALQGNYDKALENFRQAISIKRELKEKGTLLATIHRAYSLLDISEREALKQELLAMDKKDFSNKEECWMMNVELMDVCMNKTESDAGLVVEMCNRITQQAEQLISYDIDDLPVEAFYIAGKRLMDLKEYEGAKNVAKQALLWIGERDALRKTELLCMLSNV
jgi:lipopolysaccharide biosynthesis regulator YciM